MDKTSVEQPTLTELSDKQTIREQQWNGRFFDPSDLSSDGIEEDGTLSDTYAAFWLGD